MKKIVENKQILEEASLWFIESRTSELDTANRRQFTRWLRKSPEHIRMYLEIAESYAHTPDSTCEAREIEWIVNAARERARSDANVTALQPTHGQQMGSGEVCEGVSTKRGLSRYIVPLAAAAAAIAVGLGTSIWYQANRFVYGTQIAEHRSLVLEDGSKIELNGRSKVRVRFGEKERLIELMEGEAMFQAAKDASRPFIVRSGGTQVRAIGTRFDVNRRRAKTIVSVVEGRVAVSSREPDRPQPSIAPLLLSAGEQAIATQVSVAKPRRTNTTAATAWTRGELEFDETSLADVIEEFNRHSRRTFVIAGSALESIHITGVYSSDDPQSFIRFLRNQPDLVVSETNAEVRIARR